VTLHALQLFTVDPMALKMEILELWGRSDKGKLIYNAGRAR